MPSEPYAEQPQNITCERIRIFNNQWLPYRTYRSGWYVIDNSESDYALKLASGVTPLTSIAYTHYHYIPAKAKAVIWLNANYEIAVLGTTASAQYYTMAYHGNHKPQFNETVLAGSDIQIGAVEIKDANTDTRADVETEDLNRLAVNALNVITTPSNSGVSVGAVSTLVLAANANRRTAVFVNDSDTVIYLALGTAASLNSGIRLNANGGSFEINATNLYRGAIYAIAAAAGGKNLTVYEGS